MRRPLRLLCVWLPCTFPLSLAAEAPPAPAVEQVTAEQFRAAVEADWLLQDRVRTAAPIRQENKPASSQGDARGAVDGIKDGEYGFHTPEDEKPWWHVDLGQAVALDRVVVFNRGGCEGRNTQTELALSPDGKAWEVVYRHAGKPAFGGARDGKPLVVPLGGRAARFVRLQHPTKTWLHLDEVEVFAAADPKKNIALGKPADQSSASMWSIEHTAVVDVSSPASYPFAVVLERGQKLSEDLRAAGAPVEPLAQKLNDLAARIKGLPKDSPPDALKRLYLDLRWTVRQLAFANPLLSFERILYAKRAPTSFSHMSDQYYGWWSRPGGNLFLLSGWRRGEPQARTLVPALPTGSFLRPDLSYDASRVLFAYCRYYPETAGNRNKRDKKSVPDDAFYHLHEIGVDGQGLRQLTRGRYDDFDGRYLPDGRIVFLSTRRGVAMQCGRGSAEATVQDPFLPDSYVRCGGDDARPVAVYTLHVMNPDGSGLRAISPFENFEWTPSVDHEGRILFARWDYVDRYNMPFMGLWSVHPDGTNPAKVYGNFTRNPHCIFEARAIPDSTKLVFTASGHHALTAGSLCLLDTRRGTEETPPLTRLTPEVCFPESEAWPATFYNSPYPLSEKYFLVAWSPAPVNPPGVNALGLYLFDAFGNLELLYRDPALSSECPIPFRPRPRPHALPEMAGDDRTTPEGRFLLLDVYRGLGGVPRGAVQRLRIVAVPAKTQPQPNQPNLGATGDDPGKLVLGTVPVEQDGSAFFRAPAGVIVFFQALDADGMALQTMRTVTCTQPGQTLSCAGCHESRSETPPNTFALAVTRAPSPITPGPDGSWPLRYDQLVQPVLDKQCVRCHKPDGEAKAVAKANLTPAQSYAALVGYAPAPTPVQFPWQRGQGTAPGQAAPPPSGLPPMTTLALHAYTRHYYGASQSVVGAGGARLSPVLAHLLKGHHDVKLSPEDLERLVTWMDTYGQRQGHFSEEQERQLLALRERFAPLLSKRDGGQR